MYTTHYRVANGEDDSYWLAWRFRNYHQENNIMPTFSFVA